MLESDKEKAKKVMEKLIKDGQTPIIGTCSRIRTIGKWEQNFNKRMIELDPSYVAPNPIHVIREAYHSVKCIECGKHWCCDECAIEEDAIPGFLSQWKNFKRSLSKENKNIRLVTCLKCKAWNE